MKTFSYARARDAAEAVTGFTPGTMYLGGGTNLVDLMRLGVATPDRLVDVSRLPLDGIGFAGETLHIGAAVRNSDLAALRGPAEEWRHRGYGGHQRGHRGRL